MPETHSRSPIAVSITSANINEYRGTFDVPALSPNTWDIFDKQLFDTTLNARLSPVSDLISTRHFLGESKKGDPRESALSAIIGAQNKTGPLIRPLKVTYHARKYRLDRQDVNAFAQILMLCNWPGEVPIEISYNYVRPSQPEQDKYDETKVRTLMEVYTDAKKHEVKAMLLAVRHEIEEWMEPLVRYKRVHSLRWREKEASHLSEKIERWPHTHPRQEDALTKDNFFELIEDLAGARILVLYRHDLAIVDHFVCRSSKWQILKAEANYDENRAEDERFFSDLGFRKDTKERMLKPRPNGYASMHYILASTNKARDEAMKEAGKCELQVRTIHEEAWGEFSHEFSYPLDQVDPLANRLIKRLSAHLHQAEDIVSDIRRSPADGRLFRRVHEQLWEHSTQKRLPPEISFDVVHEMLADIPFLTRSAPLAAVGLLAPYSRKNGDKLIRGAQINAREVVTLGFGGPDTWGDDELQALYLNAHAVWRNTSIGGAGDNRSVIKFFVWHHPAGGAGAKGSHWRWEHDQWLLKVPECFDFFKDHVSFRLITRQVFDRFHDIVERIAPKRVCPGLVLRRTQFFIWRTGDAIYDASLPRRRGQRSQGDIPVKGFYSPFPDPDLLAGMLWLPNHDDANGIVIRILNAYASTLLEMQQDPALVTTLEGTYIAIPSVLDATLESKLEQHAARLVQQFPNI